MAEVPRVAKLGHAWLQDQVVTPRVARESHAWLRRHAWPSSATRGFPWPRVALRPRVAVLFFPFFWRFEAMRDAWL